MILVEKDKKNQYDLAIVGAGIIGASAAWLAARNFPGLNIIVLERDKCGAGTSFFSASLDLPLAHTHFRKILTLRSRKLYSEMRNEIPHLPFEALRAFLWVNEKYEEEALSKVADDSGFVANETALNRVKNEFPFLRPPKWKVMISGLTAHRATSNSMATKILEGLQSCPCITINENTEITDIVKNDGSFLLQASKRKVFVARKVIEATGPWLLYGPAAAIALANGIRIKKVVAFHIESKPQPHSAVHYFFEEDAFLMPMYERGQWLFSYRNEHWDVKPDLSTLKVSGDELEKAVSILNKFSLGLAAKLVGEQVFCDGYTNSGDPLIISVPGNDGYVIAGAAAGSGFRLGPAIAEHALSLLQLN